MTLATSRQLCEPGVFSQSVHVRTFPWLCFPLLEHSKSSCRGAAAPKVFTHCCLSEHVSLHTKTSAGVHTSWQHPCPRASKAKCCTGNPTFLQRSLCTTFACLRLSRQDVANPICRCFVYVPLFGGVNAWHPDPAAAPLLHTDRPAVTAADGCVVLGTEGCCFHGSNSTTPLVINPTIKMQTKINQESDFSFPTLWTLGGVYTLWTLLETSGCHCGFSHLAFPVSSSCWHCTNSRAMLGCCTAFGALQVGSDQPRCCQPHLAGWSQGRKPVARKENHGPSWRWKAHSLSPLLA